MDREKDSKTERKGGPSGDILPDNARKEDDEDTGMPSFQPPDPVQKETDPGSKSILDRKEESVRSGEAEKKQTEDTGMPSFQPPDPVQKETDPGSKSILDRKEESVRSGEAEKKQTEKTTEKQHHSGTEPKIDREGENDHKPEKSEDLSGDSWSVNAPKEDGPSGDILPDDAQSPLNIPKHEEEEIASDKHEEEVKRDENVQPQITVPVNNKDTGMPSFQPPDPVQKETDPGSKSILDRKEESVRSGEAEKKQTEDTGMPSFQPPDPVQKETDPGSKSKLDRKEESVRSGEAEKKQTEDTLMLSCQLPDPVQKGTDPGSESRHDRKEKSVRSSEAEEKQTESPLNIPKREEEEIASDKHEEEVKRDENVQPQITVPVNNKTIWTAAAVVILIAVVCALCPCSPDSTSSKTKEVNVVDLFNQEMKKLETTFPNQHPELWRRSLIHLRRHLKTKNPTEPVSLILTSDRRAEKTLGCLALRLARAFSTAHNSSVLKIDGKNKASQDSDQVKLDIDSELRKAFEGKKSAAVIHHFEELPPGSTLIFYRYCDHENAAYKDVFLAFTVMLDAEVELPSSVSLGRVEEMVQEHIKHKFVSSDKSAMFNQMDVDKLGGLWSRISHLILPVAAEKKFEEQGCKDWDK